MKSALVVSFAFALAAVGLIVAGCGCGSDDLSPQGTLAPDITLVSPVGAEVWTGTQDVTWQTTLDPKVQPGTVRVEVSVNGGLAWSVVEPAAPDTGTYAWDTTGLPAGRLVRIRVTATDSAGGVSASSASPADLVLLHYGWTRRFGGSGLDRAAAVAADATGAAYVGGIFQGTVDFRADWGDAADSKSSAGGNEGFLTRILPDGSYGYTRRIGGGGDDMLRTLAVSPTQGVVASSTFGSTVDFRADWGGGTDPKTSGGGNDVGVTVVNPDGSYGWTRRIGTTPWEYGAVAAGSTGAFYVVGNYSATLNFQADWLGTDSRTPSGVDCFVTRIEANGAYGWTRALGGTGQDSGRAAGTDAAGNLYVVGEFQNSVDFRAPWGGGTDVHNAAGGFDVFLLKINADGSYGWARRLGGAGDDFPCSLAVDAASGAVYATGYFNGTVDFRASWGGGTDSKTSAGGRDVFVTKVNADGSYGWTRRIGGTSGDGFSDFGGSVVDGAGRVYVTAQFSGTADFRSDWGGGTDSITSAGGSDLFVTCILADGTYGWTRRIGGPGNDFPHHRGIAYGGVGRLFVGGVFNGTVDFSAHWAGTDSRTSAGGDDAFITMIQVGP